MILIYCKLLGGSLWLVVRRGGSCSGAFWTHHLWQGCLRLYAPFPVPCFFVSWLINFSRVGVYHICSVFRGGCSWMSAHSDMALIQLLIQSSTVALKIFGSGFLERGLRGQPYLFSAAFSQLGLSELYKVVKECPGVFIPQAHEGCSTNLSVRSGYIFFSCTSHKDLKVLISGFFEMPCL